MMIASYTLKWKDRDGAEITYTLTGDDGVALPHVMGQCIYEVRRLGYPGHRGGWINYLLHDLGILKASSGSST